MLGQKLLQLMRKLADWMRRLQGYPPPLPPPLKTPRPQAVGSGGRWWTAPTWAAASGRCTWGPAPWSRSPPEAKEGKGRKISFF